MKERVKPVEEYVFVNRGGGVGWAGWAFAHPVLREQNRKLFQLTKH